MQKVNGLKAGKSPMVLEIARLEKKNQKKNKKTESHISTNLLFGCASE